MRSALFSAGLFGLPGSEFLPLRVHPISMMGETYLFIDMNDRGVVWKEFLKRTRT